MNQFDPYQVSAADGLPWLAAELAASPGVVVWPVLTQVMVPAAVVYLALWAVVTLITRHPGEALPEPEPEPVPAGEESSFAAAVLAGRVPIEQTVEIRRGRVGVGS